ncbi:MAG: tripartite tricarboxylate transporter permease [Nitrospinota bacterium]
MEALDLLALGFAELLHPERLVFMLVGVVLGLVIGAIPGVGGTTGVAILLPMTVFLDPAAGLIMLGGIYWGSIFGGSVSSILFAVPGNPWSVATMFDGRPLAKQGRASLALSAAFSVSFVSAIVASLLFTFLAVPFAELALRFGPPELFGVLLIAYGTFVGLGGSPAKALVMMAAGFLLSAVGLDVVTGDPRLTFGTITLLQGFHFVPVTIGLYGVGEVLYNATERYKLKIEELTAAAKLGFEDLWESVRWIWRRRGLTSFCTVLGFIVGILPGVGATPASFIAYGTARRTSKTPESFGKGALEGVIAPEAANNAAATGAILPMLVLGVPGSPTAAIMMAGVFMWGLLPGPRLFTENPQFVWAFVASLYVANLVAFAISISATPLLAAILRTPYALLAPIIVVLCVVGSYAIQTSLLDVWLVLIFGVLGFTLRKLDYPLAPLVVALVLGDRTETTLRQSLIMSDGSLGIFFTRPIAAPLTIAALVLFALPLIQMVARRVRSGRVAVTEG